MQTLIALTNPTILKGTTPQTCFAISEANCEISIMVNMENVGTLEITEKLGQKIISLYDRNNFENNLKYEVDPKSGKKNHPYLEKSYKQMGLDALRISR